VPVFLATGAFLLAGGVLSLVNSIRMQEPRS
jgi:hypothetical protein